MSFHVFGHLGTSAAKLAQCGPLSGLREARLAQLDHLAIVGADKPRGAEQIGLAQAALRHFGRVVGKAEMRPDEIELALAARHDVTCAQRIDLLLDDQAGKQRDHEGKLVEQWRAASGEKAHEQRLADVLGSEFVEQSVTVNYESSALRHDGQPAVRVWGVAGIPDAARSRADQQFAYVNGRYVRDKVLTHAARSAYEDVLHGHRQPVYALYVEIDPSRVDVNVHPTKIEVRFRDSREVHQAVRHDLAGFAGGQASRRPSRDPGRGTTGA